MKLNRLFAFALLAGSTLFFSCKKDIDTEVPNPPVADGSFQVPAPTPLRGSITGQVVDENNVPVADATANLGAISVQTDTRGFFEFNNATLDKYITTVTISKAGYFKAYRSFSANASRNYLSMKLIPKTVGGTVDAASGGAVTLGNGATISLPANGIVVKGTGAAFTGSVNVYAAYIDPTTEDFGSRVPGSMNGVSGSTMFALQSAGMLAVDLESTGGQALQLATGTTAQLKMPIPASILDKAPATIDTWSLDDRGIWVKEGTANRVGNFYEMQVSHFSFWNCDVPTNAVYLTLHLTNQNGQPLQNTYVRLSIPGNNTWWGSTHGTTDSTGTVSGLVPANQGLAMSVAANSYNCTSSLFTQNIGPFASDTSLAITVTLNQTQTVTVSGVLNNCNGQAVASGTATVLFGNYIQVYAPIVNGAYSVSQLLCSNMNNATVWLYDDSTNAYAGPITVPITGTTVTVPTQQACTTQPNANFTFAGCSAQGVYYVGTPLNTSNVMVCIVNVQTPGTYTISSSNNNGFSFAASGTFNQVGTDTVVLSGIGTPVNTGNNSFGINSPGASSGCGTTVFVGQTNQQASYNIGGPGQCTGAAVLGNYVVNYGLTPTNYVMITATVTSPGYYSISTNSANGMMFSDSGYFQAAGTYQVQLMGSGMPLAVGAATFVTQGQNGTTGCSFIVNSTSTGSAVYTFDTTQAGNCNPGTVTGNYQVGVAMTPNNTMSVQIFITSPGSYSLITNTINGIYFLGSGVTNVAGSQVVVMTAQGTPTTAGTFNYTATGALSQGCNFAITTN